MTPLGCSLVLLVTVINVQQARSECITPNNFLPFGVNHGDTEVVFEHFFLYFFDYSVGHTLFGQSGPATKLGLFMGVLSFGSIPNRLIDIRPVSLDTSGSFSARVGHIYHRHSTDPSDLSMVNSMACEAFDGVFIVTYACFGMSALAQRSYQILLASGPTKSVLILNYMTPPGPSEGFIRNPVQFDEYPLDAADIADDGITIIDVTNLPTVQPGEVIPVETGAPCPGTSKTCSVYLDGSVNTLNGSTVVNELTMEQSFVATVDKAERKKNSDPCKFFLMIRATEAFVPVYYVRIAIGVHPKNNRKYLRKFQFSLTNDSFVKELGYSLSSGKFLYEADMPYAMDDTGSAEPLEITVDVTGANDGWIIKSATCGYSFTHLWNNQDPIVTMTLDGNRYDGRIQETCAGM